MTHPVSHGADSRQPFFYNGKRVPYTEQRMLKDGSIVYDFQGPRVNGKKPSRITLKDMTPTEAFHEIERQLPLVREGKTGDRTAHLEPTYQKALAAMKSGEFKHSQGRYSERSIELFEQRATDHVLRLLGHSTKVVEVKAPHLRKMMTQLEAEGLGGSTVRGCVSCASTILRYAVMEEIRDYNPANEIGRGERPSAKRKTPPRYLSITQARMLFAKLSDDSRPIAETMFWAALRVSEALALRWRDVEEVLDAPGTKTRASGGRVPLHPELVKALKAHRTRMAKRGLHIVAPDALVFQTRVTKGEGRTGGKPLSRRNVLRAIQRAAVSAGLVQEGQQPVGCHDLRHSLAANYLREHKDIVEASRLLRHANPQVTATVYADLLEDGVEELGKKLAALG